jgi:hypothetical protein
VTEVPPPDILQQEHVPPAPKVMNMTIGAVSDADAQHWADASNWDSGWYAWAEARDQPGLLIHLVGAANIPTADEQALSQGADIFQPSCNLYPISNALFTIGPDGKQYFARKHLPTDAAYVFVVVYHGPCSETVMYPDGRSITIQDFAKTTTAFVPGALTKDRLLGDIWYVDAGGNCDDPSGPPPEWCGR